MDFIDISFLEKPEEFSQEFLIKPEEFLSDIEKPEEF